MKDYTRELNLWADRIEKSNYNSLQKAEANKPPQGFTPIPGSKKGGFHKRVGNKYQTWYPNSRPWMDVREHPDVNESDVDSPTHAAEMDVDHYVMTGNAFREHILDALGIDDDERADRFDYDEDTVLDLALLSEEDGTPAANQVIGYLEKLIEDIKYVATLSPENRNAAIENLRPTPPKGYLGYSTEDNLATGKEFNLWVMDWTGGENMNWNEQDIMWVATRERDKGQTVAYLEKLVKNLKKRVQRTPSSIRSILDSARPTPIVLPALARLRRSKEDVNDEKALVQALQREKAIFERDHPRL